MSSCVRYAGAGRPDRTPRACERIEFAERGRWFASRPAAAHAEAAAGRRGRERLGVCSDHLELCTSRRFPSRELECSQLSSIALAMCFESDDDLELHRCVRLEVRTSMCTYLGKQVVVAIAVDRRVLRDPLPHCPDRTAAGQSGSSSVSPLPGGRCSSAALAPQALGPIS